MEMPSNSSDAHSGRYQTPPRKSRRPPMSPMVRGVVDHPLSSKMGPTTSSEPVRTPATSTYAASLVQSAAKSILDNTPSSAVSDDDDSSAEHPPSPGLSSLLTKTLPALPDKQDRKRFIGCLTAIMASAYEYDCNDDGDDTTVSLADSFAYLDDGDDLNVSDVDENDVGPALSHSSTWSSNENNNEASAHIEGGYSAHGRNETDMQNPSRIQQSTSRRMPANGGKSDGQSSSRRKARNADAAGLAQNRHRLRRYETLSDLLLSSAELLLLEKSQAKAFLPMLDRVLSPTPSTKARPSIPKSNREQSRPSWRQRPPRQSQPIAVSPGKDGTEETLSDHNASSFVSISSTGQSEITQSDFSGLSSTMAESSILSGRDRVGGDSVPLETDLEFDESLRPFLESLSPGSGFRCLSLLLLQHLLHSAEGYDARIRHVFKTVGVVVLVQEMKRDACDFIPDKRDGKIGSLSNDEYIAAATRKFEALEHAIAWKLLHLSSESRSKAGQGTTGSGKNGTQSSARKKGVSREQIVRGLKIGSAGIVAGTLFAVTGGLAAPGIAAGVAAVAGSSAATAAVVTLTSSAAITAIFGVGGGGLAAYKMQRRTQGLTQFEFQKESGVKRDGRRSEAKVEAELFSTICLSGWLRDECDFQRPWGVTPSNPRIKDRQELLERFYAVYKPEYIPRCSKILSRWKGQERELWQYLRETYGTDPSHLFPLDDGPRQRAALTHEQVEIVDKILCELGFSTSDDGSNDSQSTNKNESSTMQGGEEELLLGDQKTKIGWRQRIRPRSRRGGDASSRHFETPQKSGASGRRLRTPLSDSFRRSRTGGTPDHVSQVSSGVESTLSSSSSTLPSQDELNEKEGSIPKHVSTVWDYQAIYGGEQYTVKWESSLLLQLSDSVEDLAIDMMGGATTHILRQTAFSTLLSAMALPYVLVNAANMIDGTWTLAIERSEEAGKELARSLLFSRAGYRPVVLIGFSMGARTIYTCLKELARYQEKWEELRQEGVGGKEMDGSTEELFELMREPASIIEDAILMGMPNHLSLSSWAACRRVVAGRLVNCYSRKDLVLSLMFKFKRLSGGLKPVCGTCPVEVHGVENVDVSDLVSSHQDYCLVTGEILKRVRHGQPFRHEDSKVVSVGTTDTELG